MILVAVRFAAGELVIITAYEWIQQSVQRVAQPCRRCVYPECIITADCLMAAKSKCASLTFCRRMSHLRWTILSREND